jgi:hypothetical protein
MSSTTLDSFVPEESSSDEQADADTSASPSNEAMHGGGQE